MEYQQFVIPNFRLQRGAILPQAVVAYKTYGALSATRDNVILYPSWYGAQHPDLEWAIGENRILDPTRYFIVVVNQFGNGLSSSPSTLGEAFRSRSPPVFTHVDNVEAQRQLLADVFGITRLALVYGWSMGGQQALHWGALHPECVARICALCTSAKTSPHNRVFLEGLRATLHADGAWRDGTFDAHPTRAVKAFARVYAGWALSQAFYRELVWAQHGYESLEDFLVRGWEQRFLRRDPRDLLSMLDTWLASDISDNDRYHGDLTRALGAITARTLVMPASTDLYFTVEDSRRESALMPHAELRVIASIWGHRAGNPWQCPDDETAIRCALRTLLACGDRDTP
ncbi:MAG: alpha/beta fold hydrolase [Gammaproteobacteria bacterium]|nr:alpha/beta fold hydrolase [Gammaproteobacteria bacterium]